MQLASGAARQVGVRAGWLPQLLSRVGRDGRLFWGLEGEGRAIVPCLCHRIGRGALRWEEAGGNAEGAHGANARAWSTGTRSPRDSVAMRRCRV